MLQHTGLKHWAQIDGCCCQEQTFASVRLSDKQNAGSSETGVVSFSFNDAMSLNSLLTVCCPVCAMCSVVWAPNSGIPSACSQVLCTCIWNETWVWHNKCCPIKETSYLFWFVLIYLCNLSFVLHFGRLFFIFLTSFLFVLWFVIYHSSLISIVFLFHSLFQFHCLQIPVNCFFNYINTSEISHEKTTT